MTAASMYLPSTTSSTIAASSIQGTGIKELDSTLRASAQLESLRTSSPVGPFALIGRAQQDLELQTATVADLGRAMDQGTLTSEQLTEACLARITTYEPVLHAVITLNPNALAEAKALDAEHKAGKEMLVRMVSMLIKMAQACEG